MGISLCLIHTDRGKLSQASPTVTRRKRMCTKRMSIIIKILIDFRLCDGEISQHPVLQSRTDQRRRSTTEGNVYPAQ